MMVIEVKAKVADGLGTLRFTVESAANHPDPHRLPLHRKGLPKIPPLEMPDCFAFEESGVSNQIQLVWRRRRVFSHFLVKFALLCWYGFFKYVTGSENKFKPNHSTCKNGIELCGVAGYKVNVEKTGTGNESIRSIP
jgi:hypothetical protein